MDEENDIPEMDLHGGVRGKSYEDYQLGTNVIVLDPDVAAVFRDSAIVNQALREYLAEHGAPPKVPNCAGSIVRGTWGQVESESAERRTIQPSRAPADTFNSRPDSKRHANVLAPLLELRTNLEIARHSPRGVRIRCLAVDVVVVAQRVLTYFARLVTDFGASSVPANAVARANNTVDSGGVHLRHTRALLPKTLARPTTERQAQVIHGMAPSGSPDHCKS